MDFGSIFGKIGGAFHSLKDKISANDTLLLTGVSCVGVVVTGVLAFKAGPVVKEAVDACNADIDDILQDGIAGEEAREMIKACKKERNGKIAKAVAGTVITGTATIACDILREKKWSDKFKDLAFLYALNQKKFEEFKDKTKEIVGPGKAQKIDDELVRDHAKENRLASSLVPYNTGFGISYFQIENSGQLLISCEQWFHDQIDKFNDYVKSCGPRVEVSGDVLYTDYFHIPAPDNADLMMFDEDHKAKYRIVADRDDINGVENTVNIIKIIGGKYDQYNDRGIS